MISTEKPHDRGNTSVRVVIEDLKNHPVCPHGPTLLFSKITGPTERRFFGCSACRDRKLCNFFLWAEDLDKVSKAKQKAWDLEAQKFLKHIKHRKLYQKLLQIKGCEPHNRVFCITCSVLTDNFAEHVDHALVPNLTDYHLQHPTEVLPPLDNAKKSAQYLFSKESVQFLVDTFLSLGYRHVICIGTPRIHEYIQASSLDMSSILLDLDDRFHNFFGPLEFCWYNMFNNHFFFEEARNVFNDFLESTHGEHTVLVTDPPFGGRTEPLVETFNSIRKQYRKFSKNQHDLPVFWIFPYFMEPQIINSLPDFHMSDYKVQYDNHPLFHNEPKGRKQGSPVRIFTNVGLCNIALPVSEYKFCKSCSKWVAKENKHCPICKDCTSKNGETYVHCKICSRCVKPNWKHCEKCQRCTQVNHSCRIIKFSGTCLLCQKDGHKKKDCPSLIKSPQVTKRRKIKESKANKQKRKKML